MPFDPDAYLKKYGAPQAAPPGGFDPDKFLQQHDPKEDNLADDSWVNRMARFGRGEARQIAGDIQRVGSALPGAELPFLPESAREARRKASGELTKFAEGGKGIAEGAGKVGGMALEALAQPEYGIAKAGTAIGGRAIPFLARLAEGLAQGTTQGAIQGNPLGGAIGGAVPPVAGAGTKLAGKGAEWLGQQIGPSRHFGHIPGLWALEQLIGHHAYWAYPLGWLTAHFGQPAGKFIEQHSPVISPATGQIGGAVEQRTKDSSNGREP